MKLLRNFLSIISIVIISSCKKDHDEIALEASTVLNVSYGADSRQNMDVYLPAGRDLNTPVIVLVHGGGFITGDKGEFTSQSQALSNKGFVVINVNYRLVDVDGVFNTPITHKPSAVKISDQLNDIQSAVNFAVSKRSEWKMSSTQWAMTGHSAGGTLALLYAYGDKNAGQIKVAGNWAGATTFAFSDESEANLLDPKLVEVLYRAVGAEIKNANKLAYMAVSPFWLAYQGRGIATINIRPESNSVGDLPDGSKNEYQNFTDALTSKAVPNKWVEVAGSDHGFSQAGKWTVVIDETAAFFSTHLD